MSGASDLTRALLNLEGKWLFAPATEEYPFKSFVKEAATAILQFNGPSFMYHRHGDGRIALFQQALTESKIEFTFLQASDAGFHDTRDVHQPNQPVMAIIRLAPNKDIIFHVFDDDSSDEYV
jgi:hypothetical protein